MTFILRNDQLGRPIYLAGTVDLPVGEGLAVSTIIFNAHPFDTDGEARAAAEELPGRWTVSETGPLVVSSNLVGTQQ